MAVLALLAAALALAAGAWRGGLALPAVPLWPLAGFVVVGLLQLVPLPDALHALLAPGSHAVWRPAVPEAAAVLGGAARPVSVDPDSTLRGLALAGGLAVLAVLAAPALSRPDRAARAVAVVAACGFALSAYAIFARARFGALLYGTIAVPTVSPFGPFVNKNHFAGWVAMAALLVAGLALGLADGARGRRRRLDDRPSRGRRHPRGRGRPRHGPGRSRLALPRRRRGPRGGRRVPRRPPLLAGRLAAPTLRARCPPSCSRPSWGRSSWPSCPRRRTSGCAP